MRLKSRAFGRPLNKASGVWCRATATEIASLAGASGLSAAWVQPSNQANWQGHMGSGLKSHDGTGRRHDGWLWNEPLLKRSYHHRGRD